MTCKNDTEIHFFSIESQFLFWWRIQSLFQFLGISHDHAILHVGNNAILWFRKLFKIRAYRKNCKRKSIYLFDLYSMKQLSTNILYRNYFFTKYIYIFQESRIRTYFCPITKCCFRQKNYLLKLGFQKCFIVPEKVDLKYVFFLFQCGLQ